MKRTVLISMLFILIPLCALAMEPGCGDVDYDENAIEEDGMDYDTYSPDSEVIECDPEDTECLERELTGMPYKGGGPCNASMSVSIGPVSFNLGEPGNAACDLWCELRYGCAGGKCRWSDFEQSKVCNCFNRNNKYVWPEQCN